MHFAASHSRRSVLLADEQLRTTRHSRLQRAQLHCKYNGIRMRPRAPTAVFAMPIGAVMAGATGGAGVPVGAARAPRRVGSGRAPVQAATGVLPRTVRAPAGSGAA